METQDDAPGAFPSEFRPVRKSRTVFKVPLWVGSALPEWRISELVIAEVL